MVSDVAVEEQQSAPDGVSIIKSEIRSFLKEKMEHIPSVDQNITLLTVGVEHEFFLVDQENKPANAQVSQEFMLHIASLPGWNASENFSFNEVSKIVWRISHRDNKETLTSLKYKHHPHHFELTTPLCPDMHELKNKLERKLVLIENAAQKFNLKVFSQSLLGVPSFQKSVMSDIPYYADMRNFRTKLYLKSGEAVDSEAVNFPAVMASSKTVIGGVNWYKQPEILQRLYLIEPKIQSLILPRKSSWNGADIQEVLRRRWNGILAPHKFSPLVGFPRIVEWNIEEWLNALMRMPLPGPKDKPWTARTLNELKESPFGSPSSLLNRMSEFQMIAPDYNGSVKFNSDPTQTDLKYLMNLVAFRLGLTAVAALGFTPKSTLIQSEKEWKKRINGEEPLKSKEAPAYFAAADKGLRLRKQAEEKYLVLM